MILAHSGQSIPTLPQRREPPADDAEPSTHPQLNPSEALAGLAADGTVGEGEVEENGVRLCADCRTPIRADPRPEEMCIFLHALRYEMTLGAFETDPPAWAAESWTWGSSI
jgi:tRNA pseudouridine32 synthase